MDATRTRFSFDDLGVEELEPRLEFSDGGCVLPECAYYYEKGPGLLDEYIFYPCISS
jgi:hypothetical protein